jgi:ADP-ribose pyrophosphatase
MLPAPMRLPPFPGIALSEVEDLSPSQPAGFLRLRRHRLRATFPDGGEGTFVYDSVDRTALDAVVIVAHFRKDAARHVYLRSALRPPPWLRGPAQRPYPEADTLGALWEVPAGLLDPGECSREGLARCAARELAEEVGFTLPAERFAQLGPSTFPAPGVIGERHHFFHVEVDPRERGTPSEDGSVLERGAVVFTLPLVEAIDHTRTGAIEDAKTELALRRLAEL